MMYSFLEQLRATCEARKIPLISRETQAFLGDLLVIKQPKRVLEIGAAVGYSALCMANIVQAWEGSVSSFEIGYTAYLEALKNIKEAKQRNITLYPFDINEIVLEKFFSEKFDFVFIDAQKSQYGEYMEKIQQHLHPENTLLLDDIIKYQNKLDSLYGFIEKKQIDYQIFPMEEGDGVMLIENLVK
ncbi:MAG: class I SAM-dependent methyltransferase [Candidatus Absconditabacteria bacterium]|nr:class I SAM-dependent methyltransferase [Candidatus Absconditabacteria bacterium]